MLLTHEEFQLRKDFKASGVLSELRSLVEEVPLFLKTHSWLFDIYNLYPACFQKDLEWQPVKQTGRREGGQAFCMACGTGKVSCSDLLAPLAYKGLRIVSGLNTCPGTLTSRSPLL